MALLANTQAMLERVYGFGSLFCVEDFLVTDRAIVERLESSESARDCDEKLLLAQDEFGLEMSLFIDAKLLARLGADDPSAQLNDLNLPDFCTALEGVSHFLYVTHRAAADRQLSLAELELQAEVDKYIGVHVTLAEQGLAGAPRRVLQRLFEQVHFDPNLSASEKDRYDVANRYAGRYCNHLERYYLGRSPLSLSNELRHFYGLSHRDKLHHIDSIARL